MAKKSAKKVSQKGKRMADGGPAGVSNMMYREPGATPGSMPGRKPGRGMPGVEPGGMGRNPGRGLGRGIGGGRTNYPGVERPGMAGIEPGGIGRTPGGGMGRPTTGGGLPPYQNMGPAKVYGGADLQGATSTSGRAPGGTSATTGITFTGGGIMTPNMNRDPSVASAPRTGGTAGAVGMKMGMRGGGLARKGKGQALAKGGMVKGSGCVSKGMKKPRYT